MSAESTDHTGLCVQNLTGRKNLTTAVRGLNQVKYEITFLRVEVEGIFCSIEKAYQISKDSNVVINPKSGHRI